MNIPDTIVIGLLFGCFLTALILGWIITPRILLISYQKRLFDIPNERKNHSQPIPRLGGLSFLPSILIAFCLFMSLREMLGITESGFQVFGTEFMLLASGSMILYLAGVGDDLVGMSYGSKLFVQLSAALLLTLSGNWIKTLGGLFGVNEIPVWIGIPLSVFIIVYIINAINLIDGIDGLASGLSCISLIAIIFLLVVIGHYAYALLAVATLGVLIPFWFYNVWGNALRGHKLFMGDTGSLTLGFILAFLVIHLGNCYNFQGSAKSLVLGFSTLLVPLFDVVRVVVHRLREHRNPFYPDRNHFHHKLLRTGLPVHQVMLVILLVSVFFLVLNYYLCNILSITGILFADGILWILMHLIIDYVQTVRKAKNTA